MESSRAVLEEMLNEITHVLMVDAAVAEVVGEKPETTQRQAVRPCSLIDWGLMSGWSVAIRRSGFVSHLSTIVPLGKCVSGSLHAPPPPDRSAQWSRSALRR